MWWLWNGLEDLLTVSWVTIEFSIWTGKNPRLICHCMSQNWMLMVSCEQPLSLPRHPQNLTLQLPTFKGWPPKAKHLASSFQAPIAYQHASEEHLTSHKRCKSQRRCLEYTWGILGVKLESGTFKFRIAMQANQISKNISLQDSKERIL